MSDNGCRNLDLLIGLVTCYVPMRPTRPNGSIQIICFTLLSVTQWHFTAMLPSRFFHQAAIIAMVEDLEHERLSVCTKYVAQLSPVTQGFPQLQGITVVPLTQQKYMEYFWCLRVS